MERLSTCRQGIDQFGREGLQLRKLRLTILAGATLALFGGAVVANATHTAQGVDHTTLTGNVTCSTGTLQVKVDPPVNGIVAGGAIEIYDLTGSSFSWRITPDFLDTYDAGWVLVKGGPNTEAYDYTTSNAYDDDQGLTAPVNPKNGKTYGLSHISFCFDPKAPS